MSIDAPPRIYNQYRDKPKAVAWMQICHTMAQGLEQTFEAIRTSYDIDNATGANLDALETLVSVPSYDLESVPGNLDVTKIRRILIKATIAKNVSDTSYDSIVTALKFVTGEEQITIIDNEDMTFDVNFGRPLNDEEVYVLANYDIMPRPTAVEFKGYDDSVESAQFGDEKYQWGDDDTQFGYLFGGG